MLPDSPTPSSSKPDDDRDILGRDLQIAQLASDGAVGEPSSNRHRAVGDVETHNKVSQHGADFVAPLDAAIASDEPIDDTGIQAGDHHAETVNVAEISPVGATLETDRTSTHFDANRVDFVNVPPAGDSPADELLAAPLLGTNIPHASTGDLAASLTASAETHDLLPPHPVLAVLKATGLRPAETGETSILGGVAPSPETPRHGQHLSLPAEITRHHIDQHRKAGLGEDIWFVATNSSLTSTSYTDKGLLFAITTDCAIPGGTVRGVFFAMKKLQASAFFFETEGRYPVIVATKTIVFKRGRATYRVPKAPEGVLPEVGDRPRVARGTIDGAKVAALIKHAKPYFDRHPDLLGNVAITPEWFSSTSIRGIFHATVSTGDADFDLTPTTAVAVAAPLRVLGNSIRVEANGSHMTFSRPGAVLVVPQSPPLRLRLPLDAPSRVKVEVKSDDLLWPLVPTLDAISGSQSLQLSLQIEDNVVTLEAYHLGHRGGQARAHEVRATIPGVAVIDRLDKAQDFLAYVDAHRLLAAISQSDQTTQILEWVAPDIVRLIHTVDGVPVHMMLTGQSPDRNGQLPTGRRR